MAFDSLIRSVLSTADKLTSSLQGVVVHYAWIGKDIAGNPTYATPVSLKGVINLSSKQWNVNGKVITVQASVTFPRPIKANGASGRIEPIDLRDKIILPNGLTGPIIYSPNSIVDRSTGMGYMVEIGIGAV